MRYLMTIMDTNPPDDELVAEMGRFVQELTDAGVLVATGGLAPGGTRVTSSAGRITVTDGPFAEAKEVITSFALIDVPTKAEAIELARRFWAIVGEGHSETREVFGPPDTTPG